MQSWCGLVWWVEVGLLHKTKILSDKAYDCELISTANLMSEVQLNCLLFTFAWNLVTQKWLIDTLINPTSWFWQEKNVYHWPGPHCAPLILLMLQAMLSIADVLFELTVISSSWLHSIPKTLLMLEPAAKFVKFSPELV